MVTRICVICASKQTVLKLPSSAEQAKKWKNIALTYNSNIKFVKSSLSKCLKQIPEDFTNYDLYTKGKIEGKDVR